MAIKNVPGKRKKRRKRIAKKAVQIPYSPLQIIIWYTTARYQINKLIKYKIKKKKKKTELIDTMTRMTKKTT